MSLEAYRVKPPQFAYSLKTGSTERPDWPLYLRSRSLVGPLGTFGRFIEGLKGMRLVGAAGTGSGCLLLARLRRTKLSLQLLLLKDKLTN